MKSNVEAAPFINTIGDQVIKNELYNKPFDVKHLGNKHGNMPVFGVDFHETTEGYAMRLKRWKLADREVLFDGWIVKDMQHWQVLQGIDNDVNINIEFNSYSIFLSGHEYKFPVLPDTIDDFINDCKRIGIKLFWKQEIIDKFDAVKIISKNKVVEYHKIIRENLN